MRKIADAEKSKMKAISLSEKFDSKLLEIGEGSRTAGIKELLEFYSIIEQMGGKSVAENKQNLIILIHEKNKKAA